MNYKKELKKRIWFQVGVHFLKILMKNSKCSLYHTGGKVDRDNQSCVGSKAARLLNELNIDLAFVSTSSWSLRGISTPSVSQCQTCDFLKYGSNSERLLFREQDKIKIMLTRHRRGF